MVLQKNFGSLDASTASAKAERAHNLPHTLPRQHLSHFNTLLNNATSQQTQPKNPYQKQWCYKKIFGSLDASTASAKAERAHNLPHTLPRQHLSHFNTLLNNATSQQTQPKNPYQKQWCYKKNFGSLDASTASAKAERAHNLPP